MPQLKILQLFFLLFQRYKKFIYLSTVQRDAQNETKFNTK